MSGINEMIDAYTKLALLDGEVSQHLFDCWKQDYPDEYDALSKDSEWEARDNPLECSRWAIPAALSKEIVVEIRHLGGSVAPAGI